MLKKMDAETLHIRNNCQTIFQADGYVSKKNIPFVKKN